MREGVPGEAIELPVVVDPAVIALPNCESYVTVNEFAVHWAYRTKLEVWPCAYGNEIAAPPVAAANHPVNVYPVREGVPGEAKIEPPVIVAPAVIPLPTCESYVIVNEFADHCA